MKYLFLFFSLLFYQSPAFCQWSTVNSGLKFDINENIVSMAFATADKGFACTTDQRIVKTTDGGKNWSFIYPDTGKSPYYSKVLFYSAKTGFICSSFTILKTNDGGDTWKNIPIAIYRPNKLFFLDDSIGFCGESAQVCITKDGGTSWSAPIYYNNYSAGTAMYFSTINKGYIPADKGIIKLSDSCKKNTSIKLAKTSFNAINFVEPAIGYLAGHDSAAMLYTSDSGNTWQVNGKGLAVGLFLGWTDVHFINKDTGYTCGDSHIYTTTNGGKSWEKQYTDSTHLISGFCFVSSKNIYAFGRNALLLHTTNGGFTKTGITETSHEQVLEMDIFPNPFSVDATIRYTLREPAMMQMGLYDITGRQISQVITAHQQPGNYQTIINAGNLHLSKGIYLLKTQIDYVAYSFKLVKF